MADNERLISSAEQKYKRTRKILFKKSVSKFQTEKNIIHTKSVKLFLNNKKFIFTFYVEKKNVEFFYGNYKKQRITFWIIKFAILLENYGKEKWAKKKKNY